MNVPETITNWVREKVENHNWATVKEGRVVTHKWSRQTGGRVMSASLSASIEPAESFVLDVKAKNIEQSFIDGALNGVLTVLMSQSFVPVLGCKILLYDFKPHEVESSYAAFYFVAEEATKRLLGIGNSESYNIVW
jgi:hypothetical protein